MNKKTQVLILAAGRGQRFADAGYTEPKLLFQLRSKPVLSHNLDTLLDGGYQPVVVGSPAVCRWLKTSGYDEDVRIIKVSHLQPSPVHSALLASGAMDPERGTWILDGDQIYTPKVLKDIVCWNYPNATAVVAVEGEPNRSRCDVVFNSELEPSHLEEKVGRSRTTVAGGYYFPQWQQFQQVAFRVAYESVNVLREARVSSVVNELVREREHRLAVVRIDQEDWISAGTPEELLAAKELILNSQPKS